MTDCSVSLNADQRKRLATPHDRFGSVTPPWTFADLPGAGGIHATMRDMMRFAKAQLTPPPGKLGEAIELAWKQHRDADASGPAMGLGWIIHGDGQTRWHNGQTGGSHAAILINREFQCAVVVLCNTALWTEVDELAARLVQKAAGIETKAERGEGNDAPPKVSPFTAVRFEGEQVIVTYKGQAYQWLELNGIKVDDIVASSKNQFGGAMAETNQRRPGRIAMGHGPPARQHGETASLESQDEARRRCRERTNDQRESQRDLWESTAGR